MNRIPFVAFAPCALLACASAFAAGRLRVEDAWIRAAPPGATMLAGYATLANSGDAPLTVLTVQSEAFRSASIHRTVVRDGVSRMRELHDLELAPGQTVRFEPGGYHIMLMDPRQPIEVGAKVGIVFLLADGTRVQTVFDVTDSDGP
jgi:copper(I)-binding protein